MYKYTSENFCQQATRTRDKTTVERCIFAVIYYIYFVFFSLFFILLPPSCCNSRTVEACPPPKSKKETCYFCSVVIVGLGTGNQTTEWGRGPIWRRDTKNKYQFGPTVYWIWNEVNNILLRFRAQSKQMTSVATSASIQYPANPHPSSLILDNVDVSICECFLLTSSSSSFFSLVQLLFLSQSRFWERKCTYGWRRATENIHMSTWTLLCCCEWPSGPARISSLFFVDVEMRQKPGWENNKSNCALVNGQSSIWDEWLRLDKLWRWESFLRYVWKSLDFWVHMCDLSTLGWAQITDVFQTSVAYIYIICIDNLGVMVERLQGLT